MMKLFDKWDISGIKVKEPALEPYINLTPILVPRTAGRAAQGQRIWVQKNNIVERLMNKLMVPGHRGKKHKVSSGHCCGKGTKVYRIVKDCFEIIEKETKQNPVEIFVRALEKAASREEVSAVEYGGARYPKAVEMAPQRRIDLVLRLMVQGAYQKSFNSKKSIEKALSEEIIAAHKSEIQASAALSKKLELERQADASR